MNLFSRVLSVFPGIPRTFRDDHAGETRSAANLAAWLSDWNQSNGELQDPYNTSPWVSRAIKHIAGPIAQVDLKFYQNEMEIEDMERAAFWNRPAKGCGVGQRLSRFDLIEATVGWLCLKGGFFWVLDDTWLRPGGIKSPLLIARPNRIKPIIDDGEFIGWQFQTARSMESLIPDQVIHSHFWNPVDDFNGSAPMSSAKLAAEADHAAARYWKNLAEANGDLGETIIAPNGISAEQEEQIKIMLRRKREAAKKGKYMPSFFVGDIKTEDSKIKSPDAGSAAQRLANRHEVYIAFGVPASFAEVTASYSVGSASDRYKLIEETCMPIAAKIAEAIEEVERRRTGVSVSAAFYFDDHSTMQQVRAERLKAGTELHARGVPWNIISDHLNLGLQPFAGWDKAWLPMALVEVDGPETQEPEMEETPEEPVKVFEELEQLLKGCPQHPTSTIEHRTPNVEKRIAKWERLMKSRAPYVKKVRVLVDKAIFEARRETLAKLAAAEAAEQAERSGAFDFLFDLTQFLTNLVEPMIKVLVSSYGTAGGELLADEMGSVEAFIDPDINGILRLRARENYIKDAGIEMWEDVRGSLEDGIQKGESYKKLAERVRATFNDMSKTRAMRIAVTETSIAFEQGRHDAMIQAGAEWKEWLTSQDDRVRLTHYGLDGKRVPMAEPFIVGGFPMMFPCDPNGPPSEIINCRCVHGPADSPENPDDIEGNNPDLQIPF